MEARIVLVLALAAGVGSDGAARASAPPDPWPRLVGHWRGEGRFLGAAASAELWWDVVLGGRFVRLTQRITLRRDAGEQVFEGHAYYVRSTEARTTGTWFDVEGHTYRIDATLDDLSVEARWGPAGSVVGRTVYRAGDAGLVVVDSAPGSGGAWREFGRITYTRAPGAP